MVTKETYLTTKKVDISPSELSQEEEVRITVNDILNRQFPKTVEAYKCRKCDWKYICFKR